MLNTPQARHAHDCDDCILLANLGKDDLYVCAAEPGYETLLRRFSPEPSDYSSFPIDAARQVADVSPDWDLSVRLYDAFQAGRDSL